MIVKSLVVLSGPGVLGKTLITMTFVTAVNIICFVFVDLDQIYDSLIFSNTIASTVSCSNDLEDIEGTVNLMIRILDLSYEILREHVTMYVNHAHIGPMLNEL